MPAHAKSPTVSTYRGFSRTARGFTLLELVVVVCLVAILFTVAANRLWGLQVLAEQMAMETVIGTLRSALGMKVAKLYARNDWTGLQALEGSNPMLLLAETPNTYRGLDTGGSAERGSWMYRPGDKMLVYRVKHEGYFRGAEGRPEARFRVRLVYEESKVHRRSGPDPRSIVGVRLAAVEPYSWIE